ncbi:M1 family aminopeptidase [Cesiribacter sp. SM1]|uniref:M61 family metallopeptidase n=1 Tax=Cesiribacter sp. SM1 TaxID=2861196 RepID=UPI001CD4D507|nr:M1 family aminopeptidase [Cesiribacter sp. SM1]
MQLVYLITFIVMFFLPAPHEAEEAPAYSSESATNKEPFISYTVEPNFRRSTTIDVSFEYSANAAGELLLKYENSSWGDKDIFNCITKFKVSPEPVAVTFMPDSSLISIKAQPDQKLLVKYSVKQDFNEPVQNYHRYRPIVQKEYFHALGMRLFIMPVDLFASDTSKASIEINWKEEIGAGVFHSSFGAKSKQLLHLSREELYASVFVGGDFRRYRLTVNGNPVYFLTRGEWKAFKDDDVTRILEKTISSQVAFWEDPLEADFTVTLIPTFEEWTETSKSYSLGGSGLTHSFASFASNNDGATLSRLSWLYNHELLHRWIGNTIRNEQEEKQYWFSEGFTDYYAYKLMLKRGDIGLHEYIKTLNAEVFKPHYNSPVRELPNDQLSGEKFWSDVNYHKLPYRRGLLYAFLLDTQIKQKHAYSKSLDYLMKDLLNLAKKDEGLRLNDKVFGTVLSKYLGGAALADFSKYITEGKLIDFSRSLPEGLLLDASLTYPALALDAKADPQQVVRNLSK